MKGYSIQVEQLFPKMVNIKFLLYTRDALSTLYAVCISEF